MEIILTILIALAIIIVVFGIWVILDTNIIMKREYIVESSKIPEEFNDYKIAFMSDLHNKTKRKNIVNRVVNKINKENPDLIFLGGDYIDRSRKQYIKEKKGEGLKKEHGMENMVEAVWTKLSKLSAKDGVYSVLGNHDYWEKEETHQKYMDKFGINNIKNKGLWLYKNGKRIRIGGVADTSEDMSDLHPTIDEVKNNEFVIVVSHCPEIVTLPNKGREGVDLFLAGHTHGGQINLFGKYTPFISSRWRGRMEKGRGYINDKDIIITAGVGVTYTPFRFFVRPEYVIVKLKHKE